MFESELIPAETSIAEAPGKPPWQVGLRGRLSVVESMRNSPRFCAKVSSRLFISLSPCLLLAKAGHHEKVSEKTWRNVGSILTSIFESMKLELHPGKLQKLNPGMKVWFR